MQQEAVAEAVVVVVEAHHGTAEVTVAEGAHHGEVEVVAVGVEVEVPHGGNQEAHLGTHRNHIEAHLVTLQAQEFHLVTLQALEVLQVTLHHSAEHPPYGGEVVVLHHPGSPLFLLKH